MLRNTFFARSKNMPSLDRALFKLVYPARCSIVNTKKNCSQIQLEPTKLKMNYKKIENSRIHQNLALMTPRNVLDQNGLYANLLSLNDIVMRHSNLYQQRYYSSDSTIQTIEAIHRITNNEKKRGRKKKAVVEMPSQTSEVPQQLNYEDLKPTELIELHKMFPFSKAILNNVYQVVAQEMKDKSFIVNPSYTFKNNGNYAPSSWECTYHLKWPENLYFVSSGSTKQEASTKASLLALKYLNKYDHITNDKQPKLVSRETEKKLKQSLEPLKIKPNIINDMNYIVQCYNNELVPLLKTTLEDDVNNNTCDNGSVEVNWPQRGRSRQMYRGMSHYMAKEPVKLPIGDYKDIIIDSIRNNQVVIVKGEPGCGKSTRVPQYVLQGWAQEASEDKDCRIVVTQPRRIAAISLAERVANEREETVGSTVGYQVRLKSNFNRQTGHILYCTTGILLRRLQSDPRLSDCSHIILDEAHERDVNTDLLMNLLKRALEINPDLKLIVMSATIDAEVFQRYFKEASIVHVPGFTHPVKVNFLDKTKNMEKTMKMCEGNHPTVVHEDVVKLINFIHTKRDEGAILCFLPGWDDISKVRKLLPQNSQDMMVLCLHSRLQDSEQRLIFSKSPPGVRKVILATNIAETSVTVDDVVYVIDTGIQKEKRFDVEKGIACIDNHWISKASMAQRKGRAGRVKPGESFHLYPKSKYNEFIDYSLPEILRTSLTKIVLDGKVFSNNMIATEFLSELLSPPEESAVLKAVDELKELELLDDNECLTPLGRVLSDFQLEPNLGKALVNSVIFKCVTPIVDVVTLYSAESELFTTGMVDKTSVNKCKREFSKTSDHWAMLAIFEKWLEYMEDGDQYLAKRFCNLNNLVEYKLFTIEKLRQLHFDYLRKGLYNSLAIADDNSDNNELVKGVLLSGVGTVLQHRNFDVVKGRMKKTNILLTRNNHKATITSDSVNFKRTNYPTNYLLYINETRSNIRRITVVRETSLISPLSVLLFKTNKLLMEEIPNEKYSKDILSQDQVMVKLANTKLEFVCDRRQADVLLRCKNALDSGKQYYIYQLTKGGEVDGGLNQIWDEILSKLNDILANFAEDC
ncbi:PREDICTED: ATP-dependent RNA helicase DHX36-like [Nicrophorus vespilloides]|uniref:ATP-dependent RNA helicase DHX36-like n=1 Tax=Nicrophorus vespilloides TaxID=110193 RepID=A0ABM1MWI8_NICVS|nr:PREDICTED: ATP-dependent RNA helicase DHX36-like [Nicrophorus vespilloides]